MKYVNTQSFKLGRIGNLLAGLIITAASMLTVFSGTALALGTCFTAPRPNEPLYVYPYTTVCNTAPNKVYTNLNGVVIPEPLNGRCYVNRTASGSTTLSYVEGQCAGLNALLLASKQAACTGSGGDWQSGACSCPDGQTVGTINAACNTNSTPDPNPAAPIDLEGDGQKIYDRLTQVINALSALVGVIIVISIIMGGIQYASSGGDPQKVSAGKERVLNAIVAFFVFIFLYAFLQYIVPGGVF